MTFSRRWMYSQRASSITMDLFTEEMTPLPNSTCRVSPGSITMDLFTEEMTGKSKVSRFLTAGNLAALWQKLWYSNPPERLNKDIPRRTGVVGIIPNRPATGRLVGTVPAGQHGEWAEAPRYITFHNGVVMEAYPFRPVL